MVEQPLASLASQGILGTLLVLAFIALWWKDAQLTKERQSRIEDGKATLDLILKVQQSVMEAVHKLSEVVEFVEKRREEDERQRRADERAGAATYRQPPRPGDKR